MIRYLIDRWPDLFGETRQQRERNIALGGMKPDTMSWQEWCDPQRPGWMGAECHWYDPPEYTRSGGHCRGDLHHDHQSRIMHWYWASPLRWIIPPLYFLRETGSIRWALALSGFGRPIEEPETPGHHKERGS